MPVACRQQPAGGELGFAICSPPRKLHVYEREGENVLFFTSLPRPVSSRKTSYIPPSVRSRRLITVGKRNSATDIWVGGRFGDERVCIGVAMLSTCISFLLSAFTFMWHRPHRGEQMWEWQVEKRGMVAQSSGINLRNWDPLQVQTCSICALLTHFENKSHMENDSNLFLSCLPHSYPADLVSRSFPFSAYFSPACQCTIKHPLIPVRLLAWYRHHSSIFQNLWPCKRDAASCHWLIKGISESSVS